MKKSIFDKLDKIILKLSKAQGEFAAEQIQLGKDIDTAFTKYKQSVYPVMIVDAKAILASELKPNIVPTMAQEKKYSMLSIRYIGYEDIVFYLSNGGGISNFVFVGKLAKFIDNNFLVLLKEIENRFVYNNNASSFICYDLFDIINKIFNIELSKDTEEVILRNTILFKNWIVDTGVKYCSEYTLGSAWIDEQGEYLFNSKKIELVRAKIRSLSLSAEEQIAIYLDTYFYQVLQEVRDILASYDDDNKYICTNATNIASRQLGITFLGDSSRALYKSKIFTRYIIDIGTSFQSDYIISRPWCDAAGIPLSIEYKVEILDRLLKYRNISINY